MRTTSLLSMFSSDVQPSGRGRLDRIKRRGAWPCVHSGIGRVYELGSIYRGTRSLEMPGSCRRRSRSSGMRRRCGAEIEDLLLRFVSDQNEHFRIERQPVHFSVPTHLRSCPHSRLWTRSGWVMFKSQATSTSARCARNSSRAALLRSGSPGDRRCGAATRSYKLPGQSRSALPI